MVPVYGHHTILRRGHMYQNRTTSVFTKGSGLHLAENFQNSYAKQTVTCVLCTPLELPCNRRMSHHLHHHCCCSKDTGPLFGLKNLFDDSQMCDCGFQRHVSFIRLCQSCLPSSGKISFDCRNFKRDGHQAVFLCGRDGTRRLLHG